IVGTFIATVLSDSRPVLGLDLQGGISIVLFPVKGTDLSGLNTATTAIRNRGDGLGIAEPDVQRQGDTIVVNLPGVKDRAKAERLVGETAELRFRPVVYQGATQEILPFSAKPAGTTTTVKGGTTTTGTGGTTTSNPGKVTGTTSAPTTTKGNAAGAPTRTINTTPIAARTAAAASGASGSSGASGASGVTPTTVAPTTTVPAQAFPG